MDLIILNDGMYQLVPLTKQMMEHMSLVVNELDLFDLCDIVRLKLTTYYDYPINAHVMNDGSGQFYGCIQNWNWKLKGVQILPMAFPCTLPMTCKGRDLEFGRLLVRARKTAGLIWINTYPKEGNIRIGYCGEIYLFYRLNF